jgi:hypothetical protein
MWTPKRLTLLIIGFVFFCSTYYAYARSFLGGIDGLPALPEAYSYHGGSGTKGPSKEQPKPVDEKLTQAFGLECPEKNRPIKLDLHSRKMVLAANTFSIEPDGRVRLQPLSLAMFGKDKGDGRFVEINTVRGNLAYLTFDRPIANYSEINGRKIIAAEITGDIQVVNNRRTERRDDDVSLDIKKGPLYFEDEKHLLWTKDDVHVMDLQSKPQPIEIWGHGMEVHLLAEAPAQPKPGAPVARAKAARTETITGVKQIVLQSDVLMKLFVDSNSGFMGGNGSQDKGEPKPAPQDPPEKSQVTIKTPGPFHYDFFKDHDMAHFDIPEREQVEPLRSPSDVVVTREHPRMHTFDNLVCQHLVLRLRRKESKPPVQGQPKPPPKEDHPTDQGLEIETAHATGKEVRLASDAEHLDALCVELIYDAAAMLTTLRGDPEMKATKDGNDIVARELQIQDTKPIEKGPDKGKKYQQVFAKGPGKIDLLDKEHDKKNIHAIWNDRLTSMRDGPYDLLTLTGSARFIDDEHEQTLQADTLKVWMNSKEPEDEKSKGDKARPAEVVRPIPAGGTNPAAAAGDKSKGDQARRPHHVEANGNVVGRAPEMNIHDTSRLVIWFKDVPNEALPTSKQQPAGNKPGAAPAKPEDTPAAPTPGAPDGARPAPADVTTLPAAPGQPANPMPGGRPANTPEKKEPPRPIDLTARSVEAWVLRSEVKNTLEKIWCEGSVNPPIPVHVRQDPAKPDEKGVDIKGDTLQMNYHPEGNYLVVTGDLAQLLMDKILIFGPEVNIDQATNKAWVTGSGAMQLESQTTLNGGKLDHPVPLTIHWSQSMLFAGKFAEYHGNIQAEQQDGPVDNKKESRLACQALQVFFDRPISLKEGNKSEQPARVQNLICDRSVRVEETVEEKGKLAKYQRLEATSLSQNTLEKEEDDPRNPAKNSEGNEVRASGPGNLRIFQRGGTDPLAPPPDPNKPPPPPPKKEKGKEEEGEMKLTYVEFGNNMYANSKTNTAIFWGNVRVLNMPSDTPQMQINLAELLATIPKEAMYLSCEQLTVLNRRAPNGKSQQEMLAKGRCVVQSKEYWGNSDTVTYNEAKDQIIFEGGENGQATLYKKVTKGGQPQVLKGRKITYLRSTGECNIGDGNLINGE